MKNILLLVAAGLAVSATAQVPPGTVNPPTQPIPKPPGSGQIEPTFETLDTNADDRISLSEAQAYPPLVARFPAIDRQGKGYITRAEYQMFLRGVEQ